MLKKKYAIDFIVHISKTASLHVSWRSYGFWFADRYKAKIKGFKPAGEFLTLGLILGLELG